jgi:transcriptional regulator with XRE-family HTH domain
MVLKRRIALMDEVIKIGEVLSKLRKARKLSQEHVAHLCDLERKTITNLETNIHLPILDTFGKYAVSLNMKPSELMKEIEENSNFLTVISKQVDDRR